MPDKTLEGLYFFLGEPFVAGLDLVSMRPCLDMISANSPSVTPLAKTCGSESFRRLRRGRAANHARHQVDRRCVTRATCPAGRSYFRVAGSKGAEYLVLPKSGFCECDTFATKVVALELLMCKHVIAAQVIIVTAPSAPARMKLSRTLPVNSVSFGGLSGLLCLTHHALGGECTRQVHRNDGL